MEERWKPITSHTRTEYWSSRYEVSDRGRVRNSKTFYILTPFAGKLGHLSVMLNSSIGGKTFNNQVAIGRAVAIAFKRQPPNTNFIRHKDGNPNNNQPRNLTWY